MTLFDRVSRSHLPLSIGSWRSSSFFVLMILNATLVSMKLLR